MKIYRAPKRAGGYWKETDDRPLGEFAANWTPNARLEIDATINKSGERHTAIGLQFSASDVADLSMALFEHYKKEAVAAAQKIETMAALLGEINDLAQSRKKKGAGNELLLAKIEALIGQHWSLYFGIK